MRVPADIQRIMRFPHTIRITTENPTLTMREVPRWCYEEFGRFSVRWGWVKGGTPWDWEFRFVDQTDAMLFKLRWMDA